MGPACFVAHRVQDFHRASIGIEFRQLANVHFLPVNREPRIYYKVSTVHVARLRKLFEDFSSDGG